MEFNSKKKILQIIVVFFSISLYLLCNESFGMLNYINIFGLYTANNSIFIGILNYLLWLYVIKILFKRVERKI